MRFLFVLLTLAALAPMASAKRVPRKVCRQTCGPAIEAMCGDLATKRQRKKCRRHIIRDCRRWTLDCQATPTITPTTQPPRHDPPPFGGTSTSSTTTPGVTLEPTTTSRPRRTTTTSTTTSSTSSSTLADPDAYLGVYTFVGESTAETPPASSTLYAYLRLIAYDVTTGTFEGDMVMSGGPVYPAGPYDPHVYDAIVVTPGDPIWHVRLIDRCVVVSRSNEPRLCWTFRAELDGVPREDVDVAGSVTSMFSGGEVREESWTGRWIRSNTSVTLPSSTTTSSTTTTTEQSTTTTTLQSADCAGPTTAYLQRYDFAGMLVTDICKLGLPDFMRVNFGSARLGIAQRGLGDGISGTIATGPRGDVYDVEGNATYPEWTMQSADGQIWAWMRGLPREREGCQVVPGAMEVRLTDPDCVIRWEGDWRWFDN